MSVPEEIAVELYEMAPCGYLTTDPTGRIIRVNQTLASWLGYDAGDLVNRKRLVDLLTVGGRMFFETHFNLLLRVQDAVNEIALDFVCQNGGIIPTLVNARQKRNDLGEPLLNHVTIFNATERRGYERSLLATRDLLRVTLHSIGDGVVSIDAEGSITYLNPVAENLSGWKNDEVIGRHIDEVIVLVGEETGLPIVNPVCEALRSGSITGLSNHTLLIARDGRKIPIDDSGSPIRDANENIIGGVLVFRDISERRRSEEELRAAYRQLEAAAAELRRSNEDLSQFAHVASHDLRSPIGSIVTFSDVLEKKHGAQLGDDGKLLTFISGAARRAIRLIEDLLAYAHVSSSPLPALEWVDAEVPLQKAIANLDSAIAATGAAITYAAMPRVRVNETSLLQVFQNLIGNAIHYRAVEAPRIHIAVQDEGAQWLFSCTDNGVGVRPGFETKIFAPFTRLHGSERPGSGIGLAVCQRIVERYQGRIWVSSTENHGSTFYFTLPKA